MPQVDQLFEAWTSDAVEDRAFPLYSRAPSDAEAAAAGSPFVHGISRRPHNKMLVRFWCHDRPVAPETRVDFESLVETLDWRGGPVLATPRFVVAVIVATYFETYVDGFYRAKGVRTLRFRSMRDGAVFVVDHRERFHQETDLDPFIERVDD